MTDSAIQTEGLTRRFGPVVAVDDLSLQVPRGSIFGFLGPNGSGKTTTIHLLLGLLEPSSGSVRVLGLDPLRHGDEVRAHSGALLEYPGLYERLSAQDNLDFYGRVWRIPPAARAERVKELLGPLDLWERRHEPVGDWSRGMKQKLAVARALFHRPEVAFLDEPTAGLDPVAAASLRDDLERLVSHEGVTVFLTTHNLPEAERLCDLVGVIRVGKLLAVDTPERLRLNAGGQRVEISGAGFSPDLVSQLRARPDVRAVEQEHGRLSISLNGEVSVAPLVRLLVEGGAEVEEVHKGAASLEEAFLSLMEQPA